MAPTSVMAGLLALLALAVCSVSALYEDQRSQYDWYQRYLGKAIGRCINQANGHIAVATESNVVGAVDGEGNIVWRKVFSSDDDIEAVTCVDDLIIVSSRQGQSLKAFNTTMNGALAWEKVGKSGGSGKAGLATSLDQKYLVWATANRVKAWRTADFHTRPKKYNLDNGSSLASMTIVDGSVYLLLASEGSYTALALDIETMELQATQQLHTSQSAFLAGSSVVYAVDGAIHVQPVPQIGSYREHSTQKLLGSHVADTHVMAVGQGDAVGLVAVQGEGMTALLAVSENADMTVVKQWKGAWAIGSAVAEDRVYATAAKSAKGMITIEALSANKGQLSTVQLSSHSYNLPAHHGHVASVFPIVDGTANGNAQRLPLALLVTKDSALIGAGRESVSFVREEGLASVLSARFVDLPNDQSEMSLLMQEFQRNQDSNMFSQFVGRIGAQFIHLKQVVSDIVKGGASLLGQPINEEKTKLTGDDFGLRKIVVVLTEAGKVYGLFSSTGQIAWAALLEDGDWVPSKLPIMLVRPAANYIHPPVVWAQGETMEGKFVAYKINPITGEFERVAFDFEPITSMLVTHADETGAFPIVVLDKQHEVHLFGLSDESDEAVDMILANVHFFTVNEQTGVLQGYRVARVDGKLVAQDMWRIHFPPEAEKIMKVAYKQPYEPIKLQFETVDDKNTILYKYLNPNLLVVLTLNKEGTLFLFLIDSVTGNILHRAAHANASGPVNALQFEHTVLYQFYDKELQRYQVVVNDLFESSKPEERIPFESSQSAVPIVARQAYVFPTAFVAMGVTVSQQNIAARQILLGLPAGGLYALDRKFVDTRRPTKKEAAIPDIPPYQPGLPYSPLNVLNYDQTLHHIREIVTAPTHLESHVLVFSYGTELFCGRAIPSGNFDRLSENFNKPALTLTVSGMIGVAIVTGQMAHRRRLNMSWR